MAPRLRVLVVDSVVVARRRVADALGTDPAIEVVATAASGRIAMRKIGQLRPDVIAFNREMPELGDGAMLLELRRTWPALPVVFFGAPSRDVDQRQLRDELAPRLQALAAAPASRRDERPRPGAPCVVGAPSPATATTTVVQIIGIGVSTGGPNALAALVPALPASLAVPIVITQHMLPAFMPMLADRLNRVAAVRVVEAVDGTILAPGTAYLAPGDRHFALERRDGRPCVRLTTDPPEHACRPAVDVMFRSIAALYGAGALGVVLTGMGQDGLLGCARIREAGGTVLAQDEASSVVWGMPGAVARAGLADVVLPLDRLASEIARRATPPPAPQGDRRRG